MGIAACSEVSPEEDPAKSAVIERHSLRLSVAATPSASASHCVASRSLAAKAKLMSTREEARRPTLPKFPDPDSARALTPPRCIAELDGAKSPHHRHPRTPRKPSADTDFLWTIGMALENRGDEDFSNLCPGSNATVPVTKRAETTPEALGARAKAMDGSDCSVRDVSLPFRGGISGAGSRPSSANRGHGVNGASEAAFDRVGCPCGRILQSGDRFCGDCGERAPAFFVCGGCGRQLAPEANYCGGCGTPGPVKRGSRSSLGSPGTGAVPCASPESSLGSPGTGDGESPILTVAMAVAHQQWQWLPEDSPVTFFRDDTQASPTSAFHAAELQQIQARLQPPVSGRNEPCAEPSPAGSARGPRRDGPRPGAPRPALVQALCAGIPSPRKSARSGLRRKRGPQDIDAAVQALFSGVSHLPRSAARHGSGGMEGGKEVDAVVPFSEDVALPGSAARNGPRGGDASKEVAAAVQALFSRVPASPVKRSTRHFAR